MAYVEYSEDGKMLIKALDVDGDFVIPEGVIEIGGRAFKDCSSLTSLEMHNSVTTIDLDAFEDCSSLIEIHLRAEDPDSLRIINDYFNIFDRSQCTLYVPIGTGYAYRHHPEFGKFKEVIIER